MEWNKRMENKRASKKQKCQINRAVLMQRNFMELEKQARKNITSGALDRRRKHISLHILFLCVEHMPYLQLACCTHNKRR